MNSNKIMEESLMKIYKLYKISYNIDGSDDVEVVNYYVNFDKAEEHFIDTCKYCDAFFNVENLKILDDGNYEYSVKRYQNQEYYDYVKLEIINVVE